jgi:hypothetical protein
MSFNPIEQIGSVLMQDLVGEYDTPDTVPEWKWVEEAASFTHKANGESGVWDFVLNLALDHHGIPERLAKTFEDARAQGVGYLLFHQGC